MFCCRKAVFPVDEMHELVPYTFPIIHDIVHITGKNSMNTTVVNLDITEHTQPYFATFNNIVHSPLCNSQ
jgi:hypothetical protein